MDKTIFFIICLFLLSGCSTTTTKDKWDANAYAYINFEHGYIWKLDPDYNWVRRDDLYQQDVIFAAQDTDTNTVIYITSSNEVEINTITDRVINDFRRGVLDKLSVSFPGMEVEVVEVKKVQIAGSEAIKSKCILDITQDDRLSEPSVLVFIAYSTMVDGQMVTFAVILNNEVEKYLHSYGFTSEEMFFSGLILHIKESI